MNAHRAYVSPYQRAADLLAFEALVFGASQAPETRTIWCVCPECAGRGETPTRLISTALGSWFAFEECSECDGKGGYWDEEGA